MFSQRSFPERAKYAPPFLIVAGVIDAPPRVAKYPVHELVLLDKLCIGDAESVGLTNGHQQQHDPHQDYDGIAHQFPYFGAHQYEKGDGGKAYRQNDFRHALGALLLEQDRVEEAEAIYRADLGFDDTLSRACQHPNNVWSIRGMHECLLRLGREEEAILLKPQLK